MNLSRSRWALVALLAMAGSAGWRWAGPASAQEARVRAALEAADRSFQQKSYAAALRGYRQALAAGAELGPRRAEAEYRLAVSLGKAEQWDEAVKEGEAFAARYPRSLWAARGHYWLGRLYLAVPHAGYRVGGVLHRGNDVPRTEGAEAPVGVWLLDDDRRNSLDHLETAKLLFQGLPPAERGAARDEEIDLGFDLARVLQSQPLWRSDLEWKRAAPGDPSWKIDPAARYDPKWTVPKKVLTLYAEIGRLDRGDRHRAALAGFARALFIGRYQAEMPAIARRWDAGGRQWVPVPYPYAGLKPEAALRALVAEFPRDPIAPQAALQVGMMREGAQDYLGALARYRDLLRRWPSSKWVSDARARMAEIARRQVSMSVSGPQPPGQPAHVQLWTRNVTSVEFTAYRVRLEELLAGERAARPDASLASFAMLFGGRREYGPVIARWRLPLPRARDHKPIGETIETPLREPGAYVVEAAGSAVRAATLVLVTDLAVVSKTSREGLLGFVVDARTGRPVPGARTLVRETYDEGGAARVALFRPAVDEDGLFQVARSAQERRSSHRFSSLVWTGDRYAVSEDLWYSFSDNERQRYQVYSYTDRSVYRPGQEVHYRILVSERRTGELKPASDRKLHVRVTDPKGIVAHESDVTTGEFGSASGDFRLGEVPPLGEYYVQVTLAGADVPLQEAGGNRFRVEEYKKPEYEVTVAPDKESARMGEPASAVVRARYYFGSPVAGARVVYKVFRTPFWLSYRFPRPFDWLYRYWNGGDYAPSAQGGDLVAQGEGHTDAAGELRVRFETRTDDPRWRGQDARYTVQAEVTDASRRVIEGSGEVKATHHAFYAFLDLRREFYGAGDRVPVEVATRDAADRPVAAKGRLCVYRQLPGPPADLREERVFDEPLSTDADGRATATWESDATGQYRIAFEAVDVWNQPVQASEVTWVAGPGLDGRTVRLQGVRLLLDRDHYAEGETARVLLLVERPESTVLVTYDAGDSLLARQVVRLEGRSQVLSIPIERGHAPNFHVTATMVRDGELFQTEHEILVPPVRQLLNVALSSDRARYRPGEKATFRLHATDWQGRPARAELSVGVVDAALAYIQKSYAPDLRVFSYGDRRGHSIPTQSSLQISMDARTDDWQPRPEYRVHEWSLPDGMGQLPDWPGLGGELPGLQAALGGTDGVWGGDFYETRARLGGTGGFGGGLGGGALSYSLDNSLLVDRAAAPAPPPPAGAAFRKAELGQAGAKEERQNAGSEGPVRSQFADTAFWTPAVVTDADGVATVTVTWPDNLTTWQATTRGWTAGAQVGQAEAEAVTYKDLLVRLQAPRFFVERDLVVLSGIVHNGLEREKRVAVRLGLEGDGLELVDSAAPGGVRLVADAAPTLERAVAVAKEGETRVDWVVRVRREGVVKVRVSATSDTDSDAMELSFPVLVHGMEKLLVQNGAMLGPDARGPRTDTLTLTVPHERKPGSSELVVQLTPSLAATMLDALPYLADYPYGCVEQTMSRFLPSVVVARTLGDLGVDLETLGRRARALAERKDAGGESRPVANSPYTYPKGRPGEMQTAALAAGLPHPERNPVFDRAWLREMVRDGLQRLVSFQHADGGWGWWRDDQSDPFMTAYVLYGLHTARAAGEAVPAEVLQRGFRFLQPRFLESDDFETMACYGYVLSLEPSTHAAIRPLLTGRLFDRRERLSAYAKALLALALRGEGDPEKAGVLVDNLETTAKVDEANGTVHWEAPDRFWWRWYNNDVETNAAALRALVALRPQSRLTPMLVRWLVNNRRGSIWRSTRETAMAVYALADYIRLTREVAPEYTVTVDVDGRVRREYTITAENALLFDNRFVVPDALLRDGAQRITITKQGPGHLYYSAYLRTFSLEEGIAAAGNEIAVRRRHFKLIPEVNPSPSPSPKRGGELEPGSGGLSGPPSVRLTYRRVPVEPGAPLASGDLIETELFLEAHNDYDYVVFEDMKPAGCEPVELRSGSTYGDGLCANMELRDQKVAFFIGRLPQGTRRLTYRLRAEIPGEFHVLPTNGYAMYAPDVRAISDEARFGIRDLADGRQQARR